MYLPPGWPLSCQTLYFVNLGATRVKEDGSRSAGSIFLPRPLGVRAHGPRSPGGAVRPAVRAPARPEVRGSGKAAPVLRAPRGESQAARSPPPPLGRPSARGRGEWPRLRRRHALSARRARSLGRARRWCGSQGCADPSRRA
jgi:hypothetical protein